MIGPDDRTSIARVIVELLGHVGDAAIGRAYDALLDLPGELHAAVLEEARGRTDLARAETDALGAGGRP